MIPLRSTERVYSTAFVTGGLIAANVAVFLYQVTLPSFALNDFVYQWAIVPNHLNVLSLATSMFLHGGWLHLLGNMLFLWVFGRNVEDLIGGLQFLVFYLASGLIAGVMGAYLIKFPRARIITLIPIIVFFTTMEIPAALLLIFWFAMQFLNGVVTLGDTSYSGGGTAWFAHIGGFIAGMILVRWFPERRRWKNWHWDE